MKFTLTSITSLCILSTSCLALQTTLRSQTQPVTIYDSSVKWDDITNRNRILASAPLWDNKSISTLFSAYQHPEEYQFPKIKDSSRYNALFINAFWGPRENPFNKMIRPAKAFIFIDENQTKLSYMAPVIQDEADKNYYIFNREQQHPELITEWVENIKQAHPNSSLIQFAICNSYGSTGNDACEETSYQAELTYAIGHEYQKLSEPNKNLSSAYRSPNEDWQKAAMSKINIKQHISAGSSIYASSVKWDDLQARNKLLSQTTTWENYQTIATNFIKLRDLRYYSDTEVAHFPRRISWLYPDDGCWTRASSVIKDLFGPYSNLNNQFNRPSKVFAFGNLCANTTNHPNGRVTWWYHTAPLIQDAQTRQTYVLDPSINAHEPLKIETWMSLIASTTGACAKSNSRVSEFNICNGYGSGPDDICNDAKNANYTTEASQTLTQIYYQIDERERQSELGREANKVLGEEAPWLEPKLTA